MDILKAKIGDKEFDVYNLQWGVMQSTNQGRSSGRPSVGETTLTLQSIDDPVLLKWAKSSGKKKDISIDFYENGVVVRTLKYTGAVAISFSQEFSYAYDATANTGHADIKDFITFVCETADYQDAKVTNP